MSAGWRRLWQTVAIGGIGLSLYAGWLTVDEYRDRSSSERDIAAACDHLVSGEQVMDLQGGMGRATSDDYDNYRLDTRRLPSACTIYKVSGAHESTDLFRLIVRSSDDSEPVNTVGERGTPFFTNDERRRRKEDLTVAVDRRPEEWPLGDGTLGSYTHFRTTIRAACGPGSGQEAPRLLRVTAVAMYRDVFTEDRHRLAQLAHTATQRLTQRIGCRTQLRALPVHMGAVPSKLRPVLTADGSCRWAGQLAKGQGQGRLPDRALTTRARDRNPAEGCLLAVSPTQVRAIARTLTGDQRHYADEALTDTAWWLRTMSYFGTEAGAVSRDEIGDVKKIKPGTAGGGSHGVWWASSICNGKPALHTLTGGYLYDGIQGGRALNSLFRAYVDDITTQRGCTHVTYPAKKFDDV